MDKNKAILVERNGEQLKYKLHDKTHSSTTDKQTAAAVEDSDKSIPVLTGSSKSKKIFSKKRPGKVQSFKPLVVAVISAIMIGSLLGFFMLRLFVGVEGEMVGGAADADQSQNAMGVADDNSSSSVAESTSVPLESLQAHVLQAGIFSEEANAVEWADGYIAEGIPMMIWEQDNQYFLLAGIAATKEQAKQIADSLQAKGSVDIYVKEWSTSSGEVELTAEEQEWMSEFQDVWQTSLANWSEQQNLSMETWNELTDTAPESTETLAPLLTSINESDEQGTQLLQWMYDYEQLIQ